MPLSKIPGDITIAGTLKTSGGRILNVTTVTDTYQILISDDVVICDKATAFTATLPVGAVGARHYVKNIGVGTVTVDGGGDTIDGEATQDIDQWECMALVCHAANEWSVI